jgi:glycosyltransferase involved in cell wall biosynthesis
MPDLPQFSVIIPTRDRFAQLAACLESLTQQDFSRDGFEVIVVNDASRLPLPASIAAFRDRLNLTILNREQSAGPGVARNCGAAQAKGAYLAFTDDDCQPAPDWLKKLTAHFLSTPGHLIGGRVINALTGNPYSVATHVILDVIYDYYDPRQGRAHFFPTSNFALSAQQFRELGGFNEKWPLAAAEDREFCYRWLAHGLKMVHAPDANVYHRHRLNLFSFCRLHFRYGRGASNYHRLRDRGSGEGGLKPDWPFHWRCLRYPFEHFSKVEAVKIGAVLLLWQFFNAAGYLWQRIFYRARPVLPAD